MLYGCSTPSEHYTKIQQFMDGVRAYCGAEEGLKALGLEYRMLPCANHTPTERILEGHETFEPEVSNSTFGYPQEDDVRLSDGLLHRTVLPEDDNSDVKEKLVHLNADDNSDVNEKLVHLNDATSSNAVTTDLLSGDPYAFSMQPFPRSESVRSVCTDEFDLGDVLDEPESDFESSNGPKCMLCMRRLYHRTTSTLITLDNRRRFIADGDMYELVSSLCQEYAIDAMCQEANLEWIDVGPKQAVEEGTSNNEALRILVNKDHPFLRANESTPSNDAVDRPSLVIATGRGKVRAGIFSREHLIGSGMEMATAIPSVREALRRNMNVIIVDHNVRGEVNGFVDFAKSLDCIAARLASQSKFAGGECQPSTPDQHDFFVLAHSASGGHLCRYLLEKQLPYLPTIRAIAFTDSTHNIQWSKRQGISGLTELLESKKCVYFRSSKAREQDDNSLWYLHRSGEPIQTDEFWQHRFGKISTFWAGTNEHSLTNWYAHGKIWQHYDDCGARQPLIASQADTPTLVVDERQ